MEAKDFIAALVDRGWTQSQIAERTGIPQPTLSKVLRGEVDDVLSRNYRKLQSLHTEVFETVSKVRGARGKTVAPDLIGEAAPDAPTQQAAA